MKNKKEFEKILALLPQRTSSAISKACAELERGCLVNEIRLREDRPASLTVDGRNVVLPLRSTHSEIKGAVLALCGGSPYAYADSIEKGYIPQKDGVRCGVCPVAGKGSSIDGISSLCIRLPWDCDIPAGLDNLCKTDGRIEPSLIYSPPGVGKTTVLRMLIRTLCAGDAPVRGAVIDTKHELYTSRSASNTLADFLFGYSKGAGIELAVRTMSPEVVFCDEIGSESDADSILTAANTGVPLIASAHADCFESLMRRPQIKRLYENGVFKKYISVKREFSSGTFSFDVREE